MKYDGSESLRDAAAKYLGRLISRSQSEVKDMTPDRQWSEGARALGKQYGITADDITRRSQILDKIDRNEPLSPEDKAFERELINKLNE